MRRTALVVGFFGLVAAAATVGPALAQPTASAPSDVAADFNHDGVADLAVGVPGENGVAGAVNVLYGAGGGLSGTGAQVFFQVGGTPEPGDRFGSALAAGDFNGDGFADLAAGASGEDVGGAGDAGAVSVLYGSASGLTTNGGRLFTQVGSAAEDFDNFGWALAAGDFNHDGFADLAAGAPGEAVGALEFAGAVSVLPGSAGGLTSSGGRLFTQVGGTVEGGDEFGWALAAEDFNHDGFVDLAAGAPGESVPGADGGAGAVSALPGSAGGLTATGGRLFTQVGGAVEGGDQFGAALAAGDFNHDGFADLAAGAPSERVGSTVDAGAVSVLPGSAAGLTTSGARLFTQVGGLVEAGDEFGEQLASGDFNHDGFADLAAAAPTEDVGAVQQAGAVSVLQGSAGGLTSTGGRLFTQNSPGVPGTAETFDQFGGLEIVF
jgi:FG-GAP repeat protein